MRLRPLLATTAACLLALPVLAQGTAQPATQQPAQGAAQVAPQTSQPEEVVLYQTPLLRVRRTIYPAGKHLPMHSHKARVVVFLSNGVVRTATPDGKSHDMTFHRGMVYWSDPVTHTLDNVGGTTLDAIEVELLKPYSVAPQAFAGDALKQAPAQFRMAFANDQVRVLVFLLDPHAVAPMHDHLDRIVVQILPIHARVSLPDGSQSELTAGEDDVRFEPSVRHSVENLSDAPTAAVSIELEPPQPKTANQPPQPGHRQH